MNLDDEPRTLPPPDLRALRASVAAVTALRHAVRVVRGLPDDVEPTATASGRLLAGHPVETDAAVAAIGAGRVEALLDVGAVVEVEHCVAPTICVYFVGGLAVVYPRWQPAHRGQVYFGLEAPWLMRLAWDHGPGGGTAADLACGTGVVATALSARYERVVATDVSRDAIDAAALTLAMNRVARSSTHCLVGSAGAGLRPASFDLVVGNPPWVPSSTAPDDYLFADGGPTGMELPARFVDDAVELLAPGGVGIVLVCDTTWRDGRRPLDEQVARLAAQGLEVDVRPPHRSVWSDDHEGALLAQTADLLAGRLVGLVFRRPS